MNQMSFVAAAYAVMLGGAGALTLISYLAMKRAEK
ncbi:hypothetical protein GGQ89_001663 [Sphingomonas yabuuchiae]|jgi:hypothetical protein|uniref:Heme exporter protein D n=1 Tax=Sphingomonas yabuuchiae TaxID=172044 RepID=A0ABR6K8T4_9SPHN|nr:hypothetical protein [Sphingomonas yabuuchiae]